MADKEIIEDETLKELMEEIITTEKMDHLVNIKILPVFVSPNISKTVLGKCIRCNKEMVFLGDYDYIIEISHDIWQVMTEELRRILLTHEILHIELKNSKSGDLKKCIRKHDVTEFETIIKKFGIDWLSPLKIVASSVYNFENGEQDNIKI